MDALRRIKIMPSSRSIQLRSSLRDDLRLTAVEGVGIRTVWTFLSEVGTDVSKFASAEHFASWLGLCRDNRWPQACRPHLYGQQPLGHGLAYGRSNPIIVPNRHWETGSGVLEPNSEPRPPSLPQLTNSHVSSTRWSKLEPLTSPNA